ncbi:NADH-quinone oxidoreductase subunit C [Streptomyces sp. NPDC048242]|uniref:NADH-quinone oxidoreductase subunit C n=1 Tax=Streptomyces sp. NPDC048242 TaxID=3155026 RepID=UPI00341F973A
MTTTGWLPADTEELFGPGATAEESYDVLTVDVAPDAWLDALETARTTLTCTYFDWLSAVDEPGTGFRVSAHVVALHPVRRLLVRTTVPHSAPVLPSAVGVYAGAAWHERETHEMFGVDFTGHPGLEHLLLPENFEGHPLRKDFVLAARVAKAWPGAKEPGESEHGTPKRRQMLPPGVPDPNEWGPLKGQLPPAPTRERPARAAAGERPVRRARSVSEGSASQAAPAAAEGAARRTRSASEGSASQAAPAAEGRPVRRARSASEGSASQLAGAAEAAAAELESAGRADSSAGSTGAPATGEATGAAHPADAASAGEAAEAAGADGPVRAASADETGGPASTAGGATPRPRRTRSASDGSVSQASGAAEQEAAAQPPTTPESAPARPRRTRSASQGSASQQPQGPEPAPPTPEPPARRSTAPRSADAPWHHARPAFDEPTPEPDHAPAAEETSEPSESPQGGRTPAQPEEPSASQAPEPEDVPDPEQPAEPTQAPDRPAHPDPTTPTTPEDPTGGPR